MHSPQFSILWLTRQRARSTSLSAVRAIRNFPSSALPIRAAFFSSQRTPTMSATIFFADLFALDQKLRTGYLSLTRGEGGQNVIGPEQGTLLGVIRTQELLAARQIDGAEQYFTSAVDFGYSKTAEETLQKWNREKVLGEIVHVIRGFQPDVIILRWSGTTADGHGHHQASAILGREAFDAAADPQRFPGDLKPWRARRLMALSHAKADDIGYRLAVTTRCSATRIRRSAVSPGAGITARQWARRSPSAPRTVYLKNTAGEPCS